MSKLKRRTILTCLLSLPSLSFRMSGTTLRLVLAMMAGAKQMAAPQKSWSKAKGCSTEKLVFPYEWLGNYERLLDIRPVSHEAFYSKLKSNIMCNEYDQFVQDFSN